VHVAIRTPLLTLFLACAALAGAQEREWRDVQQTVTIRLDGTVSVRDYRTLHADEGVMEAYICVELEPEMRLTLREAPIFPQEVYTQRCADGRGTEIVIRNETPRTNGRYYFEYELEGSLNAYSDIIEWRWPMLEPNHYPVDGYRLTINVPKELETWDTFATHVQPEVPKGWTYLFAHEYKASLARVPAGEGVEARVLMDTYPFEITGEGEAFADLLKEIGPSPFGPDAAVLLPAGTLIIPLSHCLDSLREEVLEDIERFVQSLLTGALAGACTIIIDPEGGWDTYFSEVEAAFIAAGYRTAQRGHITSRLQHARFDHGEWDHYIRVFGMDSFLEDPVMLIGVFPAL